MPRETATFRKLAATRTPLAALEIEIAYLKNSSERLMAQALIWETSMQVLSSARYRSDCSVGIDCGCRLRGRCSPSDQLCAFAEPSHEEKVGGNV